MKKNNIGIAKYFHIILAIVITLLFIGLEIRFSFHNVDGFDLTRFLIKLSIGLVSVIAAIYKCHLENNKDNLHILITVILFGIADVLINISFLAGGVIFALGHMVLLVDFLKNGLPKRNELIVFVLIFLIFAGINLCFINKNGVLLTCLLLVYSLVISLLVGVATGKKNLLCFAILAFALSDMLLMLNVGLGNNIYLGHFARFVYYSSIVLIVFPTRD